MPTYEPKKKFQYRVDKNMQNPLPKDIVDTLRKNSLRYTKLYKEKKGGN